MAKLIEIDEFLFNLLNKEVEKDLTSLNRDDRDLGKVRSNVYMYITNYGEGFSEDVVAILIYKIGWVKDSIWVKKVISIDPEKEFYVYENIRGFCSFENKN